MALGINVVVGAGIFGLPSRVYGYAGAASLAAYGICALAVTLFALCLAEVGSRFSATGGPYLYARTAFGPAVGFQVGWILWLARVAAYAANSNLLAEYMSYFWSPANAGAARAVVITTVILFLTIINLIGVRDAAVTSNIFAVGKLIPLIVFIVVGLFFIDPDRLSGVQFPGYAAFSSSALLIVYAFSGFESITVPSGETRAPQRDIPFALLVTIGAVTVFYIAIQAVSIGTLPELASSTRPLADAAQRFLGGAGGAMISLTAIISISGNLNAQTLINPRILFAMAEQRQLPSVLSSTHKRFGTPHLSILFTSAVTLALALSGEFVQLVTLSVIGRLLTYSSVCAALPVLRRKSTVPAPNVRIRFGPVVSAAALLLCVWLLSNSSWRDARDAAVAGITGFVIYAGCRILRRGPVEGEPSRASLRP